MKKFRVLIPAGGRSSRSGLDYPKTLHKVGGLPILVRICQLVELYDQHPVIIINPEHQALFETVLSEYKIQASFVYQHEPRGMGDAVLQADAAITNDTAVILLWSDIPLLNKRTLDELVACHVVAENDFSMATRVGNNCYTIVERKRGKLTGVIETRAEGIPPAEKGERDIGLFVFEKTPVFESLIEAALAFTAGENKEQAFLSVVAQLSAKGKKIEGYPIATSNDVLSFNTPDELKKIEAAAAVL